ncbi:DivIVA domain-containing protein [Pseudonocardia humida]|uniref:DivIVA domain-containing protein n=1 Tax=Pseudonocardia humida TaxID=2800819 RepID=A0ABT0ZS90_9PSEU|nr:DivIVA domain-containing protein [Pseudonocardia humida]MCO1653590.1 DivIVA domain-containing protein [Pseudonocardia humida]
MAESDRPAEPAAAPGQSSPSSPAAPATPSGAAPRPDGRRFDTVLRGYDRAQVDTHLARLAEENSALRRWAAEADRRRQTAEQHAAAAESEFRALQSRRQGDGGAEESVGFRAEKLLRLAEQEAADLRAAAAREAATVVEQARAQAEKHRHEAEQSLVQRSTRLDEQVSRRSAELQERERQIAEQSAAARGEAESLHSAARRAADELRKQAESAAETVRLRAAQDAQRLREQAQQDVARLATVQQDVRTELTRLADALADGMRTDGEPGDTERPADDRPGRRRHPAGAAGG